MFKSIQLISIILPLLSGAVKAPIGTKDFRFVMSPLIKRKVSYFDITCNAKETTPSTVTIKLKNDEYVDGVVLYTHKFTSLDRVIVPYDNSYTRDQNTISITLVYLNRKSGTFEHECYIASGVSKKLDDNRKLTATKPDLVFSLSNGWSESNEVLKFSGFDELYMPDFYHKFDPRSMCINLEKNLVSNLTLGSGYLLITNRNGVFDDLNSNYRWAQININFYKDDDNYYLNFSDDLYVDKRTLKMSSTKKTGYVKTRYLFFPVNEMRYQGEYDCSIVLTELGSNRDKLTFNFKLNALLNLFGDCHNSEYCIGVREND